MLQRLFVFWVGLFCGAAVGALLVMIFTPDSGEALREQSRQWVNKTVQESLKAAEDRRQQLKTELATKTSLEANQ